MPAVLVDTGVWYGRCDPKDTAAEREVVDALYERIQRHSIVIPWPVMYETLAQAL